MNSTYTPSQPGRCFAWILYLFTLTMSFGWATPPWGTPIMQPGVAAATCAGPSKDVSNVPIPASAAFTFGLLDLRSPPLTNYGGCVPTAPLWNPPMYHHPSWNAEHLGNVYGITLDADGDIYIAAHGLYGAYRPLHHRYGNLGGGATNLNAAGTIYKINRLTGVATVFAVIPGQQVMTLSGGLLSGPGLGNVTYDATHNQFFATSLEDGKIYRINSSGTIVGSFDPMIADNGAVGLPPKRERLWAIEVHDDAVYYSVWNSGSIADPSKIRRINILGTGALDIGTDIEVLSVPGQPSVTHAVPVSDITFSNDGLTMVLGERTMYQPTYSYNHNSRTHVAKFTTSSWSVTQTMITGCNSSRGEAYGGVAFGDDAGNPEGVIWTSSADMRDNYGPHGLFGVRTADFPTTGKAPNSWKVPYDPAYSNVAQNDLKGSGGDVEIMRENRCATLTVGRIECPEKPDLPYHTTLTITNLSANTAAYAVLTPCPPNQLPGSATTGQPGPTGVITLPSPIAPGGTTTINITIPPTSGDVFCFQVTLLTDTGEECCTEKVCVKLPDCGCAQLVGRKIECELQADGTVKYTIVLGIKNLTGFSLSPYSFGYATILPPAGFSPSLLSPTPNPIPPGGTGTFKTCYFGAPGNLCFNLALHDPNFTTCCAIEVCLDLPRCGDVKPDICRMVDRIACCPPDGVTPITFTICNNSSVPRTYTWNASGMVAPGCTQVLTPSQFTPPSGTLGPIPAGGCLTGTFNVRCANFDFGDCARFQLCFTHNPAVPPVCCTAEVYRPKPGIPVIKLADPDPVISIGGITPITVTLTNPGTTTIRTPLLFFAEDGSLRLGDEAGPVGETSATAARSIVLAASQSQDLTVNVSLPIDPGARFAQLAVFIGADSLANVAEVDAPILIPVRIDGRPLQIERPGVVNAVFAVAALRVHEIAVDTEPQAQVVMRVPTVSGHRYRVEQSDTMTGVWAVSSCTAQGVVSGPDGVFIGTGAFVTCRVPCGADRGQMFFRIRDLSLD